jgi:hypothetical protein
LITAGADLTDEQHYIEEEPGRVRESYNSNVEPMAGVYAGIVDAEKLLNPSLTYDGGFWDDWEGWMLSHYTRAPHSSSNSVENVYNTCTNASPHPFCKSTASASWRQNFRNMPLRVVVRPQTAESHAYRFSLRCWHAVAAQYSFQYVEVSSDSVGRKHAGHDGSTAVPRKFSHKPVCRASR